MDKITWIWIAVGLAMLALAQYFAVLVWLHRRREKIAFLFIGPFLPRYLNRYRNLSRGEIGRTGLLFYGFIACINLALAAFLVFLFV